MSNLQAILFDLDDTLLGNDIELFMQHYFKLLGQHAKSFMDGGRFLQELLICTRAMIVDQNTAVTPLITPDLRLETETAVMPNS